MVFNNENFFSILLVLVVLFSLSSLYLSSDGSSSLSLDGSSSESSWSTSLGSSSSADFSSFGSSSLGSSFGSSSFGVSEGSSFFSSSSVNDLSSESVKSLFSALALLTKSNTFTRFFINKNLLYIINIRSFCFLVKLRIFFYSIAKISSHRFWISDCFDFSSLYLS